MTFEHVDPAELGPPRGWTNGMLAPAGGRILFVGTKRQASEILGEEMAAKIIADAKQREIELAREMQERFRLSAVAIGVIDKGRVLVTGTPGTGSAGVCGAVAGGGTVAVTVLASSLAPAGPR